MGICNLPNEEFEMDVFGKLSKLQENKENSMKSYRWIHIDDSILIYVMHIAKYDSAMRAGNPAICSNMNGAGGH